MVNATNLSTSLSLGVNPDRIRSKLMQTTAAMSTSEAAPTHCIATSCHRTEPASTASHRPRATNVAEMQIESTSRKNTITQQMEAINQLCVTRWTRKQ